MEGKRGGWERKEEMRKCKGRRGKGKKIKKG